MFSIENGNDCIIKTEKYLTYALKYVETDENAKDLARHGRPIFNALRHKL